MAIEITEFANVDIAVSPAGVSGGNFGILGFLTKDTDTMKTGAVAIQPSERGRNYGSLDSVGEDWDSASEVYLAATAFYAQTPTPTDFVALMNYTTVRTADIVGGTPDNLTNLKAITAGTFTVTVDGVESTTSGIDFSAASSEADVAAALAAAVSGISCSFASGVFTVSANSGQGATISFASGDVAVAMSLDIDGGGSLVEGTSVETPVDSLAEAVDVGVDFVGLVTHKDFRDVLSGSTGETTADIANWAEASKKVFCNTTNDLTVLQSSVTTDIASVLKGLTLRNSLTTFCSQAKYYPSAAVFGRAGSVNFSSVGSTITLNLKQLAGIPAENLSKSQYDVLKSKYASAVVQIGKTVNAYTDSRMASGTWFDTTHGLMWLENRCETDMFNLLYQSTTKIPYTQAGINTAAARLDQSLRAAVRNGLAGPGFLPDGTYLPEGYRINVVALADVAAGDKSNRVYNGLSFDMVGAGALHEVTVSGNFSE